MSEGGWIFAFIFIAGVIILLAIAKKYMDGEERVTIETDADDRFGEKKPEIKTESKMDSHPAPMQNPIEERQKQITIYEIHCDKRRLLCARCDGENTPSATHCCICGWQLK